MKRAAKRRGAITRQLRAALVVFHVLAMVLLSLPAGHKLANRRRWNNQRTQREFALWAKRLRGWGLDTDQKRLDTRLWGLAQRYLAVQQVAIEPFRHYDRLGGMSQSWGMFRSPQRKPAILQIEVQIHHNWQTVYRSRSENHTYLRAQLDHNRIRKLLGRSVRNKAIFDYLSNWLAKQLVVDFPKAPRARVMLLRFDSQPHQVRALGRPPKTSIQHRRQINLARMRQ